MMYLEITFIQGRIGLTTCELVVESWLNGQEYTKEGKVIKLPTYNFQNPTKTIKIGNIKVKLQWNTRLGLQGFKGSIISPKDMLNVPVVINDTNYM